ncbi:YeeE/YedE family protein [Thioclava sp. BHET1]|nr:YeeE/YedE family protein [Thioclava sp. BHET1]
MRTFLGFLSGLVFGLGLVISGMSNPAKVLNFLDLAGSWDPSLAFVMGGATLTAFIGYRLVWRRPVPALSARYDIPANRQIDRPLLVGSALFGIGWGIGGFCPGPAWTALSGLAPGTLIFLPAMLLGLWLGTYVKRATVFAPQGAKG